MLREKLCWKICTNDCPFTHVVKPAHSPCCIKLVLSAGFFLAHRLLLPTLSAQLRLCSLNIQSSSHFPDTATYSGDWSRSHLMATWLSHLSYLFHEGFTRTVITAVNGKCWALWSQKNIKSSLPFCSLKRKKTVVTSAALSLLPLPSFGVFLSLTCVLGKPTAAMGRVGMWIFQGGLGTAILDSLISMAFFLPWLLPPRALCLLLLWKLSLLLSMALWKEALHLKELICPQDFCSR